MPNDPNNPPVPFETLDSEAAFKHFTVLVASIPEDKLDRFNADPEIARVNARRGTDAIRPFLDQLKLSLPLLPQHELLEIPALALALGFAADRIFVKASPQEIRARQASLRPARRLALLQLEILAELGLVPADQVRHIREGKGGVDEAQDGVAIVALFREHAQRLAGRHPFDETYLLKLAEDGNWLIAQLLPNGATPAKTERNPAALLRDRLWTELNRRYDLVYKAGVEIWGRRKVDEHIPPLLSRQGTPHAETAKQAATAEP